MPTFFAFTCCCVFPVLFLSAWWRHSALCSSGPRSCCRWMQAHAAVEFCASSAIAQHACWVAYTCREGMRGVLVPFQLGLQLLGHRALRPPVQDTGWLGMGVQCTSKNQCACGGCIGSVCGRLCFGCMHDAHSCAQAADSECMHAGVPSCSG